MRDNPARAGLAVQHRRVHRSSEDVPLGSRGRRGHARRTIPRVAYVLLKNITDCDSCVNALKFVTTFA